jgi:hypothetical protein
MMKRRIFVIIVPITVTVVFAISLSVGDAMFTRQIEADIEKLFAASKNISDTIFTYKQISGLPEPGIRRTPGNGPSLIADKVNCALEYIVL